MKPLDNACHYLSTLVKKGGPDPDDYAELSRMINDVAGHLNAAGHAENEVKMLHAVLGDALSTETVQGMALQKPHGYAGDYEIIERIHNRYVSTQPHLEKWDLYFHAQAAPKAVRNRKGFFHQILAHLDRGTAMGFKRRQWSGMRPSRLPA